MAEDIAALEAALEQAEGGPLEARLDAMNALSWALRAQDVPRAHALATEAREQSRAHGYKLGQARAARTLAMTVQEESEIARILDLGEEARRLFDEADDGPGRAASRDFLATLLEYMGDLAGALPLALEALSIAQKIEDPVRQGYALSNVGGILAASGELEAAVERLEEAFALFSEVGDNDGQRAIAARLARALRDSGRIEDAWPYAQLCLDTAPADHDGFSQATAETLLAELEAARGHSEAAERLYRRALSRLGSAPAMLVMGTEIQVALGRLLLDQGQVEQAFLEASDALERVEGKPVTIMMETEAHEVLASAQEHRGNLKDALHHLRSARGLREKIAQRDARNKVAQVEARAKMDAAQKDAEIHKLRYVELQTMQSQLLAAEKMALLGRLAAGTAHELNTPLGVLRSNADVVSRATEKLVALVRDAGGEARAAERLAKTIAACRGTSEQAIDRVHDIGASFRRFTQLDQAERQRFDVREGLDGALEVLRPMWPDAVALARDYHEVAELHGWPRELNHAFLTVLENAMEAVQTAGHVWVRVRQDEDRVRVEVEDDGRGMRPEVVAHLFDVGWAEGGPRAKMRLGLAAALATVRRHGGDITVESTPGAGTTVAFDLPVGG